MKSHDYTLSSEYERTQQAMADAFYTSKYSDVIIKRYNDKDENSLSYQRKDIDLTLYIDKKTIHISEKFRNSDYGDILIELYSKYPHKKGWMENSEADFIAYFVPKKIYIINKKELLSWFDTVDFYAQLDDLIQQLVEKSLASMPVNFQHKDNSIPAKLTKAFNKTGGDTWNTISVCVSLQTLTENSVNVKEFPLP